MDCFQKKNRFLSISALNSIECQTVTKSEVSFICKHKWLIASCVMKIMQVSILQNLFKKKKSLQHVIQGSNMLENKDNSHDRMIRAGFPINVHYLKIATRDYSLIHY